jgi:hypothetical protein
LSIGLDAQANQSGHCVTFLDALNQNIAKDLVEMLHEVNQPVPAWMYGMAYTSTARRNEEESGLLALRHKQVVLEEDGGGDPANAGEMHFTDQDFRKTAGKNIWGSARNTMYKSLHQDAYGGTVSMPNGPMKIRKTLDKFACRLQPTKPSLTIWQKMGAFEPPTKGHNRRHSNSNNKGRGAGRRSQTAPVAGDIIRPGTRESKSICPIDIHRPTRERKAICWIGIHQGTKDRKTIHRRGPVPLTRQRRDIVFVNERKWGYVLFVSWWRVTSTTINRGAGLLFSRQQQNRVVPKWTTHTTHCQSL